MPTGSFTVFLEGSPVDQLEREWNINIKDSLDHRFSSVRIRNPLAATAKDDLAWYAQQYAIHQPFSSTRALDIERRLEFQFSIIAALLRSELAKYATDSLKSPSPDTVFIVIRHSPASPIFQTIPWEILERKRFWGSWLREQSCVVVSRECQSLIPHSSPPNTQSGNTVNILFVSARSPDDDIDYRLISKPVLRVLNHTAGRVVPKFVRLGTWTAFKDELETAEPGFYALVHLDLHGTIDVKGNRQPQVLFAPEGDSHESRSISAHKLQNVLKRAKIAIVVLNACNSAKTVENETTNLAGSLVRSGVSRVLAMSYEVLSDAAETFMKEFYWAAFVNCLDLNQAAYLGRVALRANQTRHARYGLTVDLKDDFVPVLYQTQLDTRQPAIHIRENLGQVALPPLPPAQVANTPDFLGRDKDIMEVERIMFTHGVVVVCGPGGVGKTAFAGHAAEWWEESRFIHRSMTYDAQSVEEPDFESLAQMGSTNASVLVIFDNVRIPPTGLQNGTWIESSRAREKSCHFALEVARTKKNIYLLILTPLEEQSFGNIIPGLRHLYSLGALQLNDFYTLAKTADPDQTRALLGAGSLQVENVSSSHDENTIAVRTAFNLLVHSQEETGEHCWHLPRTVPNEAIKQAVDLADQYQSDLIRSYRQIRDVQMRKSPTAWLTFISIAAFRRWISYSDLLLKHYVVSLQKAALLLRRASCGTNLPAEFLQTAREVDRSSVNLSEEENLAILRDEFRTLFDLLRSCGLLVNSHVTPSTGYIGLHPLLPYLLSLDIPDETQQPSLREFVNVAFAQFYEHYISGFDDSDIIAGVPRFSLENIVRDDWLNICKALYTRMENVRLCSRGDGPSALLNTLCLLRLRFDYFTSLGRTDRLNACTFVLEKVEQYTSSTDTSTLPGVFLDEALAAGYVRSWIYLSQGETSAGSARKNALSCSNLIASCRSPPNQISSASRFFFMIIETVAAVFGAPSEGRITLERFLASRCPTDLHFMLRAVYLIFKMMVYFRLLGPARSFYGSACFSLGEMVRGATDALDQFSQDSELSCCTVEQRALLGRILDSVAAGADGGTQQQPGLSAAVFLEFFPSGTESGIDDSLYQLITVEASTSPSEHLNITLQALEEAVESGSLEQQINCHRYLRNLAFKSGDLDGTRIHTAHITALESTPSAEITSADASDVHRSDMRATILLDILSDPRLEPPVKSDSILMKHRVRMGVAAQRSRDMSPENHTDFMLYLSDYEISLIRGICLNFQYLLESMPRNANGQCEVHPDVAGDLMLPIIRLWQEGSPQSFLEHCICQALPWNPRELHHFLAELSDSLTESQYIWCRLIEKLDQFRDRAGEVLRQLSEEGNLPGDLGGQPFRILRPLLSTLRLEPSTTASEHERIKWTILKVRFEYTIMRQCVAEAGLILFHESRRLGHDPYWVRDSFGEWSLRQFSGQAFLQGRIRFRRTPTQTIKALWWSQANDSLRDLEVSARQVPFAERIEMPPRADKLEIFSYVPESTDLEDSVD